ncbi:hypothetical protein D3C87_1565070 [compost metagenome]
MEKLQARSIEADAHVGKHVSHALVFGIGLFKLDTVTVIIQSCLEGCTGHVADHALLFGQFDVVHGAVHLFFGAVSVFSTLSKPAKNLSTR